MDNINILQVVGNSAYGGATYLILKWCKYLLSHGCKVDVLATDPQTISELNNILGIRVIQDIFIPREISPKTDWQAFRDLLYLYHKEKYQVVHTYTATPGFIGRIAARLSGVPVIVHHQAGWTINPYSTIWQRLLFAPLELIAVLLSSKSICVGRAVYNEAVQYKIAPKNKLVTICNGIDPSPFLKIDRIKARQNILSKLDIQADCILLGCTGRLSEQKDIFTLIQALSQLKTNNNLWPAKLLIAGEGPDRSLLEIFVITLGLVDDVKFVGFLSNIPEFLAGIDIFVTSSLWEGLSISLLEAMAAGKPIIASSIPQNSELIEHEVTGLLVSPKSPEQIASAITRYRQESDLAEKCSRAAQIRVVENYSIDRMFQETWDLYISLLKEKKHIN